MNERVNFQSPPSNSRTIGVELLWELEIGSWELTLGATIHTAEPGNHNAWARHAS